MTMGTRTVAGWVVVDGPRLADPRDLDAWVGTGLQVARTAPPRPPR